MRTNTDAIPAGPVATRLEDRQSYGPMEHLGHDGLVAAQEGSRRSLRRTYGLSGRACSS